MINSKKILIEEITESNNVLSLKQKLLKDNLNCNISVIIRNIKTREEYKCSCYCNDDLLTVDLSDLSIHFTDYEGELNILYSNKFGTLSYQPIIDKENNFYYLNNSNQLYKWFIRVNDFGEIRLSTILNK